MPSLRVSFLSGISSCTSSVYCTKLKESYLMQAAIKTIGDEDKYFSRVSLRCDLFFVSQFFNEVRVFRIMLFLISLPLSECRESQLNPPMLSCPKRKYILMGTQDSYQILLQRCQLMAGMALPWNIVLTGPCSCSLHRKYSLSKLYISFIKFSFGITNRKFIKK